MEQLKTNPFKKGSKAWIFCEVCRLDYKNGYSEIVNLEILIKHNLKTVNGGDWCRSDGPLGKYFNINRTEFMFMEYIWKAQHGIERRKH